MNKFVLEFYNCLCNEHNDNYFSVSKPNYIHIEMELIEEDFNIFQNGVKKNSSDKENFQNALYHCFSYSGNEIDCKLFVNLYAKFDIITMELVNMLESSKISYDTHMWNYFDNIKRILDQDVINKLYQILDFMLINIEFARFSFVVRLLAQLAQVLVISLFEVHENISNVIENLSSDHDYIDKLDKNYIFQYLLNLTKEPHQLIKSFKAHIYAISSA
ncbi:unnamed protein product [Rotaria sordida]|uniref:Uncharacterized protein n=2 Tax=Rotaria sordida TaxID=392033 RepID=A0A815UEJ4_9BILA|nr:unnamed protein product [Rotaria sordida]CAF1519672.1 unnamed protein product [Rotaria sordida]